MGLLDYLFASAVISSIKKGKERHNSSQSTHGRTSGYDHGYHDDCNCHDTYEYGGCDDGCDNDCDW